MLLENETHPDKTKNKNKLIISLAQDLWKFVFYNFFEIQQTSKWKPSTIKTFRTSTRLALSFTELINNVDSVIVKI